MSDATRPLIARRRLVLVVPSVLAALAAVACEKKEPGSCTSTLGLDQSEIKVRTSLGYQDRGPDPKRHCSDCQQYVQPPSVDQCGSCKVMKGPVHPRGTCNVFTPKA
jgi:hypothetical protein